MSLKTSEFYAIQCDFPDCRELYEGSEYTYWYDPYGNEDDASESGWLVDSEHDVAYCSRHVITSDCPSPDDCEWCCDRSTDTHLTPMVDTPENRLNIIRDRAIERAHSSLDRLERELLDTRYGRLARLADSTDRKLTHAFESAVRDAKPNITPQEMYELRRANRRTA